MTWAASNKATRAEASLARLMAPTRSVSPMESCFGTLKTELVYQACYKTRDATWHDLFTHIEGYYNRLRLHSALGYITPEQAER